jgi:hypothetical protein
MNGCEKVRKSLVTVFAVSRALALAGPRALMFRAVPVGAATLCESGRNRACDFTFACAMVVVYMYMYHEKCNHEKENARVHKFAYRYMNAADCRPQTFEEGGCISSAAC